MKKIKLSGDEKYLSQIKSSVVFKALAVICSFMLIPLMLSYLGEQRFGVWITLFSVVSWAVFFDLGLGNGLRNRIAENLAENRKSEAVTLLSTGYILSAAIAFCVFFAISVFAYYVDWQSVFNARNIDNIEIMLSVVVLFFLFLLNLVLSLVVQVLHATQKTSFTVFHQFLSNLIALISVFFVSSLYEASLIVISSTYGLALLASTLFVSIAFYRDNRDLLPRVKFFNLKKAPEFMGVGWQFFVIQLAVLALFCTDKIIITQLFGPEEVSRYELVLKLFTTVMIANSLILAPLWSAYTQAAVRGEYDWLRHTLRKTHIFGAILAASALFLLFFGQRIIVLWVGRDVDVAPGLLGAMFVFTVVRIWCDLYAYFLNGVGAIKVQMWLAVLQAVINIPLSIFLGGIYGVSGVVLGTSATLFLSAVCLPLSTYSYFRKNRRAAAKTECNT